MKNIFILPTKKESVLYRRNDLNSYHIGDLALCEAQDTLRTNQFIYITTDANVNGGDWFIQNGELKNLPRSKGHYAISEDRIVLSNDPLLIDSGVQALDTDSIEFIIENPREFVTIINEVVNDDGNHGNGDIFSANKKLVYKIVTNGEMGMLDVPMPLTIQEQVNMAQGYLNANLENIEIMKKMFNIKDVETIASIFYYKGISKASNPAVKFDFDSFIREFKKTH